MIVKQHNRKRKPYEKPAQDLQAVGFSNKKKPAKEIRSSAGICFNSFLVVLRRF